MTILLTHAPKKSNIFGGHLAPTLNTIITNLWSAFFLQFNTKNQTADAVEILRNPAATLDQLDWAERHLCGMQPENAENYVAGRRWQS